MARLKCLLVVDVRANMFYIEYFVLTVFTAGANLMGSDLYNNLIRYFITHLKVLKEASLIVS